MQHQRGQFVPTTARRVLAVPRATATMKDTRMCVGRGGGRVAFVTINCSIVQMTRRNGGLIAEHVSACEVGPCVLFSVTTRAAHSYNSRLGFNCKTVADRPYWLTGPVTCALFSLAVTTGGRPATLQVSISSPSASGPCGPTGQSGIGGSTVTPQLLRPPACSSSPPLTRGICARHSASARQHWQSYFSRSSLCSSATLPAWTAGDSAQFL